MLGGFAVSSPASTLQKLSLESPLPPRLKRSHTHSLGRHVTTTSLAGCAGGEKEDADIVITPAAISVGKVRWPVILGGPIDEAITSGEPTISPRDEPAIVSLKENCVPIMKTPIFSRALTTLSGRKRSFCDDGDDAGSSEPPLSKPRSSTYPGAASPVEPILETMPGTHPDLQAVPPEEVLKLLSGGYRAQVDETIIIDARFSYEFQGGHIKGAVNANSPLALDQLLFHKPRTSRCVILVHCEFSQHRGPKVMRYLRQRDREIHSSCYPKLFYPHIYLLHAGYKNMFETVPQLCEPSKYVPMERAEFADSCCREMRRFRDSFSALKATSIVPTRSRVRRSRSLMRPPSFCIAGDSDDEEVGMGPPLLLGGSPGTQRLVRSLTL